ncbi:MAG: hypothetical protein ACRCXA_14065 [Peptostreptococcaceae bacterium]
MKKYKLSLSYIFIFLMILTGCSAKSDELNNSEKEIKIVKDNASDDKALGISGIGVDYSIENLKGGKYKINFYSKEYENKEFVQEREICNLILNESDKALSVGVYQEDKIVRFFENPAAIASRSYDVTLDFFNESSKNIVLSTLEKEKVLTPGEEVPIALFSLSNEDESISSINIDEGYQSALDDKDLVVFMKLESIN